MSPGTQAHERPRGQTTAREEPNSNTIMKEKMASPSASCNEIGYRKRSLHTLLAQNHPPATMRACSAAGTKMVGRTTRLGSAQYPWKLPPQATKEMRQRKLPCHAERAIGKRGSHKQFTRQSCKCAVLVARRTTRDWAMPNTLGSSRLMQHKSMYRPGKAGEDSLATKSARSIWRRILC